MEGNCVRKGRNGRKLLRRLKPTVGCKVNKRRRRINITVNYTAGKNLSQRQTVEV
jgi:hypothetical protein